MATPIANVSSNNTFGEWRVATNQLISFVNQFLVNGNINANFVNANTSNIAFAITVNTMNIVPTIQAAYGQANTARGQGNTGVSIAQTAYGFANTINTAAIAAYGQANIARTTANVAFDQANTAQTVAVLALNTANTAGGAGVNAATSLAIAAFDNGNNRVAKSGDTMTGDLVMNYAKVKKPVLQAYGETVYANNAVGSNLSLDMSGNNIFSLNVTANNIYLTLVNPLGSGNSSIATLFIKQSFANVNITVRGNNSAGASGTVRYQSDTSPTLSGIVGRYEVLQYVTIDGGDNYFGSQALANT